MHYVALMLCISIPAREVRGSARTHGTLLSADEDCSVEMPEQVSAEFSTRWAIELHMQD